MTGQEAGGEESPRQGVPVDVTEQPEAVMQATDPETGQSMQVPEEAYHFMTLAKFIQQGANYGIPVEETSAAWVAMQALHKTIFGAPLQIIRGGQKPAKE